jgi:hypothetical protein
MRLFDALARRGGRRFGALQPLVLLARAPFEAFDPRL